MYANTYSFGATASTGTSNGAGTSSQGSYSYTKSQDDTKASTQYGSYTGQHALFSYGCMQQPNAYGAYYDNTWLPDGSTAPASPPGLIPKMQGQTGAVCAQAAGSQTSPWTRLQSPDDLSTAYDSNSLHASSLSMLSSPDSVLQIGGAIAAAQLNGATAAGAAGVAGTGIINPTATTTGAGSGGAAVSNNNSTNQHLHNMGGEAAANGNEGQPMSTTATSCTTTATATQIATGSTINGNTTSSGINAAATTNNIDAAGAGSSGNGNNAHASTSSAATATGGGSKGYTQHQRGGAKGSAKGSAATAVGPAKGLPGSSTNPILIPAGPNPFHPNPMGSKHPRGGHGAHFAGPGPELFNNFHQYTAGAAHFYNNSQHGSKGGHHQGGSHHQQGQNWSQHQAMMQGGQFAANQQQAMNSYHSTRNHMGRGGFNNGMSQQMNNMPTSRRGKIVTAASNGQLYKTKLCYYHVHGTCSWGESCHHAHSLEELKAKPDLTKTSICPKLSECRKKHCPYAHSREELRSTDCFAKTKVCFGSCENCRFGGNCRYAHSISELREVKDLPVKVMANIKGKKKAPPLQSLKDGDAKRGIKLIHSKAKGDFDATSYGDGYIDLCAGDYVAIVKDDEDGWMYGKNFSQETIGWFPTSYVMGDGEDEEDDPFLCIPVQ